MRYVTLCLAAGLILAVTATAGALSSDWTETFGGNAYDQAWTFGSYPTSGAFTQTIVNVAGGNDYLRLSDASVDNGGSAMASGWVAGKSFTDVRVASLVNIDGEHWVDHGVFGRAAIGNDSIGDVVTQAYAMIVDWDATTVTQYADTETLEIEVVKIANNVGVATTGSVLVAVAPDGTLPYGRSYYAVLDIINSGSDVVATGRLYDTQGGALLATAVLTDSSGTYASGVSGIFGLPDQDSSALNSSFDDVSSVAIPEPLTMMAVFTGIAGLAGYIRKRKMA